MLRQQRNGSMRKLKTSLIGVDQGSVVLFSDFNHNGEMWAGRGPREKRVTVLYGGIFMAPPIVHLSVDMWDFDQETNMRADLVTNHITREGFEIVFKTWGDTRIARLRTKWMAIGEIKSDEDWEVD